jgi:SRSO17 transposase
VGERRASGETKYYLANLSADTSSQDARGRHQGALGLRAGHQQLKEELGSTTSRAAPGPGLHRHALMTLIAFAFLQHRRLAAAKRGKKARRTTSSAELARRSRRHHRPAPARSITAALPALRQVRQRAA